MKRFMFKKMHEFLKSFYSEDYEYNYIRKIVGSSSFISFIILYLTKDLNIFILILIIVLILNILAIIHFYFSQYKKRIKKLKSVAIQNDHPSNSPYVITTNPTQFFVFLEFGEKIKSFFLIIPKTDELGIELRDLPDYLNFYDKLPEYLYEYEIYRGDRTKSHITKDRLRFDLTCLVDSEAQSKLKVFYLIGNDIKKINKKKKLINEDIILRGS